MKTIALFTGYYVPHTGGVERYVYNISKQLRELGYRVIIVTAHFNDELKFIEESDKETIYRLPTYKLFLSRYPIIKKNKKYRELMKKIKEEKIDSIILNTRFWLTSYIGAKFANKNSIPRCLIEHGTSHFTVYNKVLDYLGHKYEHFLTNRIKKYVKDYYGVSKKAAEWLKHFGIDAKDVFYNCIDASEYKDFKKVQNDKIIISYIGRMLKEKGVYQLIDAYRLLKEKDYEIELVLAGDGPILNDIRNKNKDLMITGEIKHDKVMELLRETDIFVHPSESEGMPTAVLEAGLMKCAIVATPVGGTTEIICDDTMGKVCKLDSYDIANKVEELILNKEERKMIQKNIHNRVINNFVWNITAKKIIEKIEYK